MERTIRVTGKGKLSVKSDMIRLQNQYRGDICKNMMKHYGDHPIVWES